MISQKVENRSLSLGKLWLEWYCVECDVSLGCFNERAKRFSQMAEEDMELDLQCIFFYQRIQYDF